jgi:hypothetical protein
LGQCFHRFHLKLVLGVLGVMAERILAALGGWRFPVELGLGILGGMAERILAGLAEWKPLAELGG